MSDGEAAVVIPPELVAAQRQVDAAFRAVGAWTEAEPETLADRWAEVYRATDAAHALRARWWPRTTPGRSPKRWAAR